LIRLSHLILVVVTLASYLPPFINPDTFWPMATMGLLAPSLWGLVLLFAVYWMWKKDNAVWLSVITLLLGWEMMSNAFAIPDGSVASNATKVNVVSLNGHGFRQQPDKEIADFIKTLDADVLLLQEFKIRGEGDALAEEIQRQAAFPHLYRKTEAQLAVFSRFPLKNGDVHYFSNRVNGYLMVDVAAPEGTFKLINAHLQTNGISNLANEVAHDAKFQEKKTWQKVKTMFGRYGRSNKVRTQQAQEILSASQKTSSPVLLAGDFNDVPTSYLYQQFRTKFQDAHLTQAWGLGTTYEGLLPGLRIDYILPDKHFTIHEFDRIPCSFSDHQAIRAEISLQKH
jgi:endonuclease/exonuclease/phosphatase family metal-dependent hydrolase